jgi:cation:H+ antiporter
MIPVTVQFIIAAGIIVIAGTALTRCSDAIAELTKLGRVLVGSIFLAGATSLPELMVDIHAVRLGLPDMAVGDLFGSSLFNLLILAVADLSHRSRGKMLSHTAAAHALSATMSITLAALAAIAMLVSRRIGFTILGIGIGPLAILVAYILGVRLVYFDQHAAASRTDQSITLLPPPKIGLAKAVVGYLISAAVIIIAAPFMATASGKLAEMTGLGGTFFGTTLVAFCTSLPELVATVVAVRIGAFDLALGNVFGSNAFNMILLVPLDLAFPGSLLAAVSGTHILTSLATILVTAVAILGQLYQAEKRIHFIEPDAALIIALIVGSLVMVYYLR